MQRTLLTCFSALPAVFAIITLCSAGEDDVNATFSPDALHAFTALEPIDTHAHVFKVDGGFVDFVKRLHLHLLDIVVANKEGGAEFPDLDSKIAAAQAFVKSSRGSAVLCTTFDPFKFNDPSFAEDAIRKLNRDFARGAVAVKIWKNIGMELKDQGHFVMPDDRRLNPIYQDITEHGKTLIAHLAEPDSCWQPPNKNSPDYSYYSEHPEWYMFRQPDHPQKATIIKARDHLLEEHPQLHVVGAHLGSLESDLDGLARRLDRYPNFAVDLAARTVYLTIAPHEKARQFVIQYQDRILYGTDLELSPREDPAVAEKSWMGEYAADWAFFSSQKTVVYRGKEVEGLALPPAVLRKLYHDNAVHWIHGIVPAASE